MVTSVAVSLNMQFCNCTFNEYQDMRDTLTFKVKKTWNMAQKEH